ncbi:hypothetical protein D3C75_989510 [compost metagenome]
MPDTPLAKAVEVDQGQHFAGLGFTLGAWHAGQFQAEGDVAQHVLPGQQRIVLEHHAALGAGALDGHAVQGDAPAAGGDEAGDQVEQRGLAAAGRPQGHQQLAWPQAQVDVGQYRGFGTGVLCADALQFGQGHGRLRSVFYRLSWGGTGR